MLSLYRCTELSLCDAQFLPSGGFRPTVVAVAVAVAVAEAFALGF